MSLSSHSFFYLDPKAREHSFVFFAWDLDVDAKHMQDIKTPPDKFPTWHRYTIDLAVKMGYGEKAHCHGFAITSSVAFWISVLGFSQQGMAAYLNRFKKFKDNQVCVIEKDVDAIGFIERVKLYHDTQCVALQDSRNLYFTSPDFYSEYQRVCMIDGLFKPEVLNDLIPQYMWRTKVASWMGVYTLEETIVYLNSLAEHIGHLPFELLVNSSNHTCSLCFCPTRKQWLLFNANSGPVRVYTGQEINLLAKDLMESLYATDFVIVSTELKIIAPLQNQIRHAMIPLARDPQWSKIHKFDTKKAKTQNKSSIMPLFTAADCGDTKATRKLIALGAEIDCVRKRTGETPLFRAAIHGYYDIAMLLVEKGANVNAQCNEYKGDTPIYYAAKNGHAPIVALLLQKGARIERNETCKETATTVAIKNGLTDIVGILLQADKSITEKTIDDITYSPLVCAAISGNADMVRILLLSGAYVNQCAADTSYNALFMAVLHNRLEVVKLLLENECDFGVNFSEKILRFLGTMRSNLQKIPDSLDRWMSVLKSKNQDLVSFNVFQFSIILHGQYHPITSTIGKYYIAKFMDETKATCNVF